MAADKGAWDTAPPPGPNFGLAVSSVAASQAPLYVPREQVIRTPKCGARGQLTTATNTTVYTAPSVTSPTGATQGALLKSLILCNTDTVSRTVSAHLVESGGSVAANRAILSALAIAASTTVTIVFPDDCCPMDSGEFLNLIAGTSNTISYRVNVVELTH